MGNYLRIVSLCFIFTFIVPLSTFASIITIEGLDDYEWLTLNETAGQSRLTVEERMTSGGDLAGWRYATDAETFMLLNSYYNPPTDLDLDVQGYTDTDYYTRLAAFNFMEDFVVDDSVGGGSYNYYGYNTTQSYPGDKIYYRGSEFVNFFYGDRSEIPDDDKTAWGHVRYYYYYLSDPFGSLRGAQIGLMSYYSTPSYISDDISHNYYGSLLVRNPVPEPTTILLFGAGLASLAGYRRKQK